MNEVQNEVNLFRLRGELMIAWVVVWGIWMVDSVTNWLNGSLDGSAVRLMWWYECTGYDCVVSCVERVTTKMIERDTATTPSAVNS